MPGVKICLLLYKELDKGLDIIKMEIILLITHESIIKSIAKDYGIDVSIIYKKYY